MAQVLLSQGVRWGDRVVGHLPETPTLAMLHLGCARIGAVPVVVPARSGGRAGAGAAGHPCPGPGDRRRGADARGTAPALGAGGGRCSAGWAGWSRSWSSGAPGRAVSLVYGRDQELGTALLRARPTCALRPCDGEDPLLLVPGLEDGPPVVHGLAGFLLCSALGLREAAGRGPWRPGAVHRGLLGGAGGRALGHLGARRGAGVRRARGRRAAAPGAGRHAPPRAAGRRSAAAGPGVLGASLDGSDAAVAPVWSPEGGGMLAARFGDVGGTPLFGVDPVLVDLVGRRASGTGAEGELCMKRSWPAQPRSLEQDHAGFVSQRLRALSGPLPDRPALPGARRTGASRRPASAALARGDPEQRLPHRGPDGAGPDATQWSSALPKVTSTVTVLRDSCSASTPNRVTVLMCATWLECCGLRKMPTRLS